MSQVVSTDQERNLTPFWKEHSKELLRNCGYIQRRAMSIGVEFVTKVFQHLRVEFVVHYQNEEVEYASIKLEEDLLSIVTVFVAKNNAKCATENRRRKKKETEKEEAHKKLKE